MKILHLFSDWKWTGPAEPTVNLCDALRQRGHEVVFAYRRPPRESAESVEKGLKECDVKGVDFFHLTPLSKPHQIYRLKDVFSDIRGIARYIDQERFDIVNFHNSYDHIIGGLAVKLSRRRPPAIRTDHKRDSLNNDPISRWFFKRYTDGLITFSEKSSERLVRDLNFSPARVAQVNTAVDLAKFDPRRSYKDMRPVFGIPPSSPVVGMVARFQRYRRTDILLEAVLHLVSDVPDVRLLLVGRSSKMRESVLDPIKRLGINDNTCLAGYRMEDYLETLACMDIFVLITPGSDGTARALREAMAMGKPVVVTKRGMLPELVKDGVNGFVLDERPESFYQALLALIKDEKLRKTMGNASYDLARREFPIERQAREVELFYTSMLEAAKNRS